MSDSDGRFAHLFDKNGWWYASAAFALVLVLGVVILVIFPADPDATTTPEPQLPTSLPSSAPEPAKAGWDDLGCNGTKGSTKIPTDPPKVKWEPLGAMSVPTHEDYGPTKVKGYVRQCYQHTPTGAVFALLNIMSAGGIAAPSERRAVVEAGFGPGPFKDEALSDPDGVGPPWQIQAFRVASCSPARCNIGIVLPVKGTTGELTIPLVWNAGDWRIDGASGDWAARPLNPVPSDYVEWGR